MLFSYLAKQSDPYWWRIFHHDIAIVSASVSGAGSRLTASQKSGQTLNDVSTSAEVERFRSWVSVVQGGKSDNQMETQTAKTATSTSYFRGSSLRRAIYEGKIIPCLWQLNWSWGIFAKETLWWQKNYLNHLFVPHTFLKVVSTQWVTLPYIPVKVNWLVPSTVQIKRLQHPNLLRFIGIAITDDNCCEYVVSEMCSKGTLTRLLGDGKFDLDWPFKCALIKDLSAVGIPLC